MNSTISVGIDDISFHIPKIYLPIETLAKFRNIEYSKLNKGLGLSKMAFNDIHEDVATMGGNAVLKIIEKNNLKPQDIGRIYLGTESSLDSAKPTATLIMGMLQDKLSEKYGENCFENCDATDITFACIGGVDALENCLNWVKCNPNKIAIVVSSDFAKYDLESTGEYTQGSGAVAMLLKNNPRLISINSNWGVATENVFDFFKPRRNFTKSKLVEEILKLTPLDEKSKQQILESVKSNPEILGVKENNIDIFKEMPLFEGQYSNDCYQEQIKKAYFNFKKETQTQDISFKKWAQIIFHLPYAFHGKRIFTEIFVKELKGSNKMKKIEQEIELKYPNENDIEAYKKFIKAVGRSSTYRIFAKEKIAKTEKASGEIGNMYTASIFMALISFLNECLKNEINITNDKIGFVAYGSGAKSKVFEGVINENWKSIVEKIEMSQLENRTAIEYNIYEKLHKKEITKSIIKPQNEFVISHISEEKNQKGAIFYQWVK